MATEPRVVAELGRAETPQEAADRKAASSHAYRSSQTARNLIAALLVTLAIVLIVILAVPRGSAPVREPIDVAAVAESVESSLQRPVIVPKVSADWVVNGAALEGDSVRAWTIVYVPEEAGYLRVAQGFDADAAWTTRTLRGANTIDTVEIDGVTWDRYRIADPAAAGNISSAISVQAGTDIILIYGSTSDDAITAAATGVADQVRDLQKESQ